MPEVLTSWDAPASPAAPPVVSSWDEKAPVKSLVARAADWVRANAGGAVGDVEQGLKLAAGITSPAIAARGGEQAAGAAEFSTMGIPWGLGISTGFTGVANMIAKAAEGKPIVPAFYEGQRQAQALVDKYVTPVLTPESPTGKTMAEGFGKGWKAGVEDPLSWIAAHGYARTAAMADAAAQLMVPKIIGAASSIGAFGGSSLAAAIAHAKRAAEGPTLAEGAKPVAASVADQLRAVRPQEAPETPTAGPAPTEGEGPAVAPIAPGTPQAFKPSTDWQPVPPDAVLPPGLEIRMNMQTGQNEARARPPAPPAPAAPPVMSDWGTVTGGETVDLSTFFRKPVEDVKDGALRLLARGGDNPQAIAAQAELDRRAAVAPPVPRAGVSPAPGVPAPEAAIPAPAGAPLFIPKPGDAPDVPRFAVKGLEVLEVPVQGLQLSAEVPQFKKEADARGVVQPLGGKFDRIGVAPIQVWQRLNGDLEVISGRHRWDLAQRSGEETMPAQVHREADGFTAKMAASLDAELNIRDEQGSVADYANYFREAGISEEAANAKGLLARAKGRTGFAIARDASPDVYAAHSAGLLSDEAAAEIARAAPANAALQAVGLKLVNEGRPISLAVNTMRALSLMPQGEAKPEQGDIFGFDDSLIKEQLEVAKRAAAAQREIREQIAAVSGATKRPEVARKLGVDVKDPEAVRAKIDELRAESERMQNWPLHPDLVEKFGGRRATAAEAAPPVEAEKPAPVDAVQAAIDQSEKKFEYFRASKAISAAKTGQPFEATLIRGEGAPESPYNALGPGEPILGPGRYTTSERAFAEDFGPNISEVRVHLDNPLVIDNDTQWRELTKKRAGWEFPNPLRMPAPGAKAKTMEEIGRLRKVLEQDGHDGVVINLPESEAEGKTLQKVFGASQVVEFNPPGVDTQTPSMFQERAPYQLEGETEAEIRAREAKAKAEAAAKAKKEAAPAPGALTLTGSDRPADVGAAFGQDSLFEPGARYDGPTSTPEFKRWFGDSKVVDADGKPLVVYHGTATPSFTTFKRQRGGWSGGVGIWFGSHPDIAGEFAKPRFADQGPAIYPVYLNITNPMQYEGWPAYTEAARATGKTDIGEMQKSLRNRLIRQGYDGIVIRGSDTDMGGVRDDWVAFDPNQIKSAIGNRGTFDPRSKNILEEGGAKYEAGREPAPIWYSQLERSIDDLKMGAAPAQGWKDQIKGLVAKGVVKQAELDAVGLNEYLDLQEGKVTKQQVQDFLKQNGVKVEETVLGEKAPGAPTLAEYQSAAQHTADLNAAQQRLWSDIEEAIPPIRGVDRANLPWWGREMAGLDVGRAPAEAEAKARAAGIKEPQIQMLREWGSAFNEYAEAQRRSTALYDEMKAGAGGVKFASYQLPGGHNYKELLLRLPPSTDLPPGFKLTKIRDGYWVVEGPGPLEINQYGHGATEEQARQSFAAYGHGRDKVFKGPHFEEPNVLSHIRFNERTDATGARVLFLEELQSDWAQKGRKQGFVRPPNEIERQAEKLTGKSWREVSGKDLIEAGAPDDVVNQWMEHIQYAHKDMGKIPAAPYVGKTDAWVALSLKRMIRYAAENGFDKIAWTNGEQQAARYDLSKQVRSVEVRDAGDGDVRVMAYQREGENVPVLDKVLPRASLPDVIGKETAERALKQLDERRVGGREDAYAYLTGEDLKVGGEGMKGFYDNIMPKVANDVLKKLGGGRVGTTELETGSTEFGGPKTNQPGFDITRTMRDRALEGQALFQPKGEYQARQKIRGQAPEGQLDLFSEVPVKGSPVKTFEKIVVEAQKVGEHKVRATKVDSPGAAASVFQDLAKSPMEKFQVLGLDKDGTPIAFFDMFAGTVTQTSVFPREVWTAIYQTPGVRSVWIAHQHPSGLAEPSRADMLLTRSLQQALTPETGVELKGHLIITKNKTIDIGPDGSMREAVPVAGGERTHTIPIMERVITKQEDPGAQLSSPTAVREFFRELGAKEPGILFMDGQHRATGWWPMSIAEMSKLKTGDVNTGLGALFRQVGRGNAAAAIAWSPDPANEAFTKAVRNVGTALQMADVKMLDAMTAEDRGQLKSYAEHGMPMVNDSVNGIVNFNIGLTPQDMAKGVGAVADLAKAALARAKETRLGAAASEWGSAVLEDAQLKTVPMTAGSDAARAIAKDFANADRLSRWQWARFDDIIKKNYTLEQQQKMWDAGEEENQLRLENVPEAERAGRGLDRLTPEERKTMDTLQEYGDALLQRARDVGMFKGEGVKYWVPRMVAMIGKDGEITRPKSKGGIPEGLARSPYSSPSGGNITTQASSLKQRKYATAAETEAAAKLKFGEEAYLARNIRTMPMAMARIERAIAGRELINAIKEFGKDTGQETVAETPKDGYFTIDHPAFKTYRYRPDLVYKEAWDRQMWDQQIDFARSIGVEPERVLSMRGGTWGFARQGGEVKTRFGGPETVLTHELGHQLDFKYGLVQKFFGGDRPKSDFILQRQIDKAERDGKIGYAEQLKKQMAINSEMRDLADLRFEGQEATDYYRKYVRKGTEKMANMVHAYVHAPEKFKAVAPTAYAEFKKFINNHPELHKLDEIKPSLTLTSGGFRRRPPGEDFDVFPVWVSKEFEGPLKSIMTDQPGKLYGAMMAAKGKSMSVIMYSPLIHNGVEWGRALPAMPGKVATFKIYFEGNVAKNNPEVMSQAIKEGLVPIGHRFFMQDITGLLETPEIQPGRSWTAKLAGGAVGLVSKGAGEAVKRGIDVAGDIWHNTLLWDRVADLQMGLYTNFKARGIKDGLDPETAGRLASHMANRFAGALPNEAMSANARKLANFVFFSRTFTLGNLGVMKDMMTGLPRDVQAQIARDAGEVARFTAKGEAQRVAINAFTKDIALMYIANSALQSGFDYLKRDKTLSEIEQGYVDRFDRMLKKTQESPTDLLKPFNELERLTPMSENEPGKEYRVLYDYEDTGTAIYVRLPTGKIGEEFLSWATSPLDILKRKEGTVARPLIQIFNNDRGFGRQVYNPDLEGYKGAFKAVGRSAMLLLSSQIPGDTISSAIDIARRKGDENDAMKVIGPLFGLTFSKGAPGGPEVGEMYTVARQHRAEVSEIMPDVKRLLKHGDNEDAVKLMYENHMTPEEIRMTLRFAAMPRARLSPQAMKRFILTAPPAELERMQRMRENQP